MPLIIQSGRILTKGSKLASSSGCCCGGCPCQDLSGSTYSPGSDFSDPCWVVYNTVQTAVTRNPLTYRQAAISRCLTIPTSGNVTIEITASWSAFVGATVGIQLAESPNGIDNNRTGFYFSGYFGGLGHALSSYTGDTFHLNDGDGATTFSGSINVIFSREGSAWYFQMPGKLSKRNTLTNSPSLMTGTIYHMVTGTVSSGNTNLDKVLSSYSISVSTI